MGNLGFPGLLVILIVALLVFGAERLPEIGRSLGKTINEFKKGMQVTRITMKQMLATRIEWQLNNL